MLAQNFNIPEDEDEICIDLEHSLLRWHKLDQSPG